jgi:hypothetical protein
VSTSTIVVLAAGIFTVVVLGLVLWSAVRRIRRAVAELTEAFARLEPAVERFRGADAVRQRELDRLGENLELLRSARARRRGSHEGQEIIGPSPVDSEVRATARLDVALSREDLGR